MRNKLVTLLLCAATNAVPARAIDNHVETITNYKPDIRAQFCDDILYPSILASNSMRSGISPSAIDALEVTWKKELESDEHRLIASVVDNPLGDHIRAVLENSDGLITEINVMDAAGLSVGQSSFNSDIWQGDEVKYMHSYLRGPKAIFVDEVELDDSSQTFQSHVSFTIVDPQTGTAIGAVSVGTDMAEL